MADRGPWRTAEEASLRVSQVSGGLPVSIWTADEGPDVLVAPDAESHNHEYPNSMRYAEVSSRAISLWPTHDDDNLFEEGEQP
jgi:hypothetical protein